MYLFNQKVRCLPVPCSPKQSVIPSIPSYHVDTFQGMRPPCLEYFFVSIAGWKYFLKLLESLIFLNVAKIGIKNICEFGRYPS